MSNVFLLGAGVSYDTSQQVVKVGQVIQMNGHDYNRYVVYEIVNHKNNVFYKLINLRTHKFARCEFIRPLSQKFGIGYYFDDVNPEFLCDFEVATLRSAAERLEREEQEEAQKKAERNEQLRAIGRERLEKLIPADAKAVIIAECRRNESDSMTDYFGYGTEKTVILGFSPHTKDLFSEMRKYAANFEGTAYLAEKNEDYEHREKYTGGAGYYLGKSKYCGWVIEKDKCFSGREQMIEQYSLIAANDANICVKVQSIKTALPEVTGEFIIVDYSEKAVAVFGNTKSVKDKLKVLGGRFNPNLTHQDEKQAGWIFSKSKEKELRNLLTIK